MRSLPLHCAKIKGGVTDFAVTSQFLENFCLNFAYFADTLGVGKPEGIEMGPKIEGLSKC